MLCGIAYATESVGVEMASPITNYHQLLMKIQQSHKWRFTSGEMSNFILQNLRDTEKDINFAFSSHLQKS